MIYTYTRHNACGASVTDVEAGRRLERVMSVNTDTGEVECCHYPYRIKPGTDQVDTYTERFRSIHAIFGDERKPVLFHCYGRLSDVDDTAPELEVSIGRSLDQERAKRARLKADMERKLAEMEKWFADIQRELVDLNEQVAGIRKATCDREPHDPDRNTA